MVKCWSNWTFLGIKQNKTRNKQTENQSYNSHYIYTKVNWKWIMDLNVKCKTVKHLEENLGPYAHLFKTIHWFKYKIIKLLEQNLRHDNRCISQRNEKLNSHKKSCTSVKPAP